MGRFLFFVALLAVIVYAVVDCLGSHARDVRSIPKSAWLAIIVLVPVVGAALWFLLGRPRYGTAPAAAPRPRPSAPDDDPEFLRTLDTTRRQQAEERRLREWERQLRERERNSGGDDPGSSTPGSSTPGNS